MHIASLLTIERYRLFNLLPIPDITTLTLTLTLTLLTIKRGKPYLLIINTIIVITDSRLLTHFIRDQPTISHVLYPLLISKGVILSLKSL